MSVFLKELRENLEILPISEVRQKAVKNFGLRLNRDDSKEDIIDRIVGAASKHDYAKDASGDMPEPGWTRIKVHPVPGKPSFPFFVGVNGYFCWIPFNVEVDVPSKVIGVLNDAIELKVSTDEYGNRKDKFEQSYPFTVIAATPGPDPRPGFEAARERKLAAKRAFAEREGYWPSDVEVREARREYSQAAALKEALSN